MIHAILTGSPWATLAGVALVALGATGLVWWVRRNRRAALWEAIERDEVMRRHPAGWRLARRDDATAVIPRVGDSTVVIPRQRDRRRR